MDAGKFAKVEVRSETELWDWLETNHGQSETVWLVSWKASKPDTYVSREAVLDALVAYGWVDGRRMKLDDQRTMQLISPRRQGVWARSYKERAERLQAAGRMRPAGEASLLLAKHATTWSASDPIDDLVEPDDLKSSLASIAGWEFWQQSAPSYRRNILRWLAAAKRHDTRRNRIAIIVDHVGKREKVPQF